MGFFAPLFTPTIELFGLSKKIISMDHLNFCEVSLKTNERSSCRNVAEKRLFFNQTALKMFLQLNLHI